jgi:thiol-disulfide isomerase/thioredoxin/uncharacterized membrane protein YphA (DoxX/SURF4 family)
MSTAVESALFLARVLLFLVFLASGLGKILDVAGLRQALLGFGTPARLVSPLSVLLPFLEIAVAISLLSSPYARYGAVVALSILMLFGVVISVNLARGRRPKCHCFGPLYSKPISWSTLIRNGSLAAIAALVVVRGPGFDGFSAFLFLKTISTVEKIHLTAEATLFILAAFGGWLILQLIRQNGRLLLRLDALEAQGGIMQSKLSLGASAPTFRLHDLSGTAFTLDSLCSHNLPIVLIFWDPLCGPCSMLLSEISRWQQDYDSQLKIVLISRGEVETNQAKIAKWGVRYVLLQNNREVAESYRVRETPAAVIVRPDRRTASPIIVGVEAVKTLVEQFVNNLAVIRR